LLENPIYHLKYRKKCPHQAVAVILI